MDKYLALVGTAKDARLEQLLSQTDACLRHLTARLQRKGGRLPQNKGTSASGSAGDVSTDGRNSPAAAAGKFKAHTLACRCMLSLPFFKGLKPAAHCTITDAGHIYIYLLLETNIAFKGHYQGHEVRHSSMDAWQEDICQLLDNCASV